MEVAATHLDDGAESAVEGATARGFHYVHLPAQHSVTGEDARAAVGQANFLTVQAVYWTRRIHDPTFARTIGKPRDGGKFAGAFEAAHQLTEGQLAFTAHDEVDARAIVHVGVRSEAGVVASHDNADAGTQRADQLHDTQRGLALEGHDRKADEFRLQFGDQALDSLADLVLNQNQVQTGHLVMGIDIPGERGKGAVRHTDRDGGHVLEGIRHCHQQNVHAASRRFALAPVWCRCIGAISYNETGA